MLIWNMERLMLSGFVFACVCVGSASATCRTVRVGTFDEANPFTVAMMTQWLDDADYCYAYYREPSGGRTIQHLEAGDLDLAILGSTPYAAAAARRADLSAVSILHFKGAAQALVTRPGIVEPGDLIQEGAVLWTPYTSTTHYILLAALAAFGVDAGQVALVTKSPAEIVAAWDRGEIDGAACWGNTMSYLLDNPWGGSGSDIGRVLIDAATVAQWDYQTGNVLGVSDAFLASDAAARAGKGCEIPNFKGSYLGRFPLVLADFWTSDHLSERSRP